MFLPACFWTDTRFKVIYRHNSGGWLSEDIINSWIKD